jgi:hypothetical protein
VDIGVAMVVGLVVLGTGAFLFLLIKYPEWVGITGKSGLKTEEEHREGSSTDDSDFLSRKAKAKDKP